MQDVVVVVGAGAVVVVVAVVGGVATGAVVVVGLVPVAGVVARPGVGVGVDALCGTALTDALVTTPWPAGAVGAVKGGVLVVVVATGAVVRTGMVTGLLPC